MKPIFGCQICPFCAGNVGYAGITSGHIAHAPQFPYLHDHVNNLLIFLCHQPAKCMDCTPHPKSIYGIVYTIYERKYSILPLDDVFR